MLIALVLKIKAKGTARDMAPAAEYLPSLCETLGSNPRIIKKVKNRRKIKASTNKYGGDKQQDIFWTLKGTAFHVCGHMPVMSTLVARGRRRTESSRPTW